ncbi:DUF4307 domain-containing protein [Kocuria rhizophila]|uniref:DUF4307 domain-containing protein n=1 Tax=Kocuria TaxID=57493 RepID=UPI000DD39B99|nr:MULTISPECIES: DUF4307 domain-containing protein [Kocuria]MCC5673121.1 DUF4307 domain-containing protein [Kocuria rhizophila]MDV5999671.1 DUF4307 domain-containing protein [Kocuria rhizophila]
MSSATSQPADGGPTPTERLARRYGSGHRTVARTPRRGPSGRGWILIAAAATLVSALFVVWIVWGQSQRPVFKDVGFQITDAAHGYADFDLTKDPEQSVTCAVQALNEQYAVVGWNEVTIGHVPEDQLNGRTSTHRVPVRTTNTATTAGVDSCWNTTG